MNLTDYQIEKINKRLQREEDTAGFTFSKIYSQSSEWGYWLIVTNERNEKLEVHVNLEVSARINGGALYIVLTDVNELLYKHKSEDIMNDLKRQLLKRSIPVGRLAKFVDIDRAYCSRILNNKICPGDDIARRLAAAANIFTQRVGYYLPSDFSTNESINDDYDMQVEALEQNIARAILTYDTYRKSQDITAPRLLQDFEAIKRLNDLVENIAKVKS